MNTEILTSVPTLISAITAIVTAIVSTITFIIKKWNYLKQTPISLTLLTYEGRKKYQSIRYWITVGMLFGISFMTCGEVGFFAGLYFESNSKYLQKVGGYEVAGLVLLLVIDIVLVSLIKKKEKKVPDIINAKDKTRYWTLGNSLYLSFILLYSNILAALFFTKKEYVLINLVVSALTGIFLCNFLSKWMVDVGTEVAYVKTIHKGQMVYLFRKQDNLFVAGDNVFENTCEEWFLIDGDKILEKRLMKVNSKEEIYFRKENVKYEGDLRLLKPKEKKEILRTIVLSGDAKEVDFNINTKITIVQVDKERICFRVNEQEELYEVKNDKIDYKVNDRNVLLI